jgi:uncharacterized protein HemX
MVLQNTVNNLRERPRNERKAIAGAAAVTVVAILFIGWAIFYFNKIQNNNTETTITTSGAEVERFSASAGGAWENIVEDFESIRAPQPGYVDLNAQ